MDQFPRKPILDRVIVREIPVEEYYRQDSNVVVDLNNTHIRVSPDRGEVVAVGDCMIMGGLTMSIPVVVGDIVFFDDFALCDPVYLDPADKIRTDLPKYWQMRVADLKGVDVARRNELVDKAEAEAAAAKEQAQCVSVPLGSRLN